jgi:hypothetical protein
MKLSLSQQQSLQLSTSQVLDAGVEWIHERVKEQEHRLSSAGFISEIKKWMLSQQKASLFNPRLAREHLLKADEHLLEQAIRMASARHNNGYRESGTPYLAHALSTGFILARLGFPREVVVSGILHDSVEDTNDRNQMLNMLYDLAPAVAWYVFSVTAPDMNDAHQKDIILNKKIVEYASKAGTLFPQAIKCADAVSNLYDLEFMGPKDGRSAQQRQEVFLEKIMNTTLTYAHEIDSAGIIPINKNKERFLLKEYIMDVMGSKNVDLS